MSRFASPEHPLAFFCRFALVLSVTAGSAFAQSVPVTRGHPVEQRTLLPLQHLEVSSAMYRQAATLNPFVAVAMFGFRAASALETEPNPTSIGFGYSILEHSYTFEEVMAVIEADGHVAEESVGTALPAQTFISIVSERESNLDDAGSGEIGGFRISVFLETVQGSRQPLGEPVVVRVDSPQVSLASSGERVENYPVIDALFASAR